jgi:hypothetical protein
MTNFASNYTPRLKVRFTVDGVQQSSLIRLPRTPTPTTTEFTNLATAWEAATSDLFAAAGLEAADSKSQVDTLSAEYAMADEDLFLPLPGYTGSELQEGDDSGGAASPLTLATLISITGRTAGGSRITLFWQGMRLSTGGAGTNFTDWRLSESEVASLTAVFDDHFATVVGPPDNMFNLLAGPDGMAAAYFRRYLNVRVSARRINKQRSL